MLKIEIPQNAQVQTRSGTRQDGSPYTMCWYDAYLHVPNKPYPKEFRISVKQGVQLPTGFFTIDDSSYYVDRYGALQVSREMKLNPIVQESRKAS